MFNFRLIRRVKFPAYWPDRGTNSLWPSNQRMSPAPYTLEKLPDGHNHFIPNENIRVGTMRWSQVYGGSLSLAGSKIQDDLVLKIIDPAFFPIPPTDPFVPDAPSYTEYASTPIPFSENSYRYTDDLMAWSEAHAYSKLSSLQGSLIPHLVDIFMLKCPWSKQDKIGIVMSRIHGRNIFDVCRELGCEIDGETGWYPIMSTITLCHKL
ncbi:hypothetical protein BDN70DRAFT_880413 [Pholiota conissans]|uniref:Uncharacterized protein n=1 Tax=Pholiota conissans TaxID=109636 RepID=A0A9P6CZ78_9AGAR|nr:hypothetical protein BDN70DRAFT_880413 [Pholiota conissans]